MALNTLKRVDNLIRKRLKSNFFLVKYGLFSTSADDVIIERKDSIGIIKLNNPKEKNCLKQSMINKISTTLDEWNGDNNLQLVILKAADHEFFSVGGAADSFVKLAKEPQHSTQYFAETYKFIYKFCTFNVPTVALVNGIMASSGATLAANCTYRVVSEKAGFSLPEVTYGFIPDDGASYYLSRESGRLGFYLALTGQQISKRDLVTAGIATHFVTSAGMENLETALLAAKLDHS
ncbi:3-hydroxyisobutyryl-CoA hydrolase-like protein [Leptotrombidium deliense]|uniref:3-hydroxyisobutyryl-CoA hydrolase, mitochondrial n=1 Tax=Leptotrombidium deliense TaxID=299467 RepID=A0A443SH20_9ACAR|nr:3-hydroxyisobutyryl-CoA hydrolase-like protein [Leptotrombidium deliense]